MTPIVNTAAFSLSRMETQGMKADLLIRGGTVVDGTGAPARQADVGLSGRHIVFVGDGSELQATRSIDAGGQVVAPGFIDIHTHSDLSLLLDVRGQSKVSQGVTSEILGEATTPAPSNANEESLYSGGDPDD